MFILHYLIDVLCWTGQLLWTMLGPFLLTAFLMQWFSNMLRSGFMKLFGLEAFVYLLAPGVMLHELGHALFCFPFCHRVVQMKLFSPQKDGTLGWVNHTYDPNSYWANIGNFFIGTGPVWLGITALYGVTYLLLPVERFDMQGLSIYEASSGFLREVIFHEEAFGWKWFIWAYLAFAIGANITLSPADIEGTFTGFVFIGLCVLIACLVSGWCYSWPSHADEAIQLFIGRFFSPVLTILVIIGIVSFIFWCVASLLAPKKRKR